MYPPCKGIRSSDRERRDWTFFSSELCKGTHATHVYPRSLVPGIHMSSTVRVLGTVTACGTALSVRRLTAVEESNAARV